MLKKAKTRLLARTAQKYIHMFAGTYRAGRVGERATRTARPTLPSSNRRCRFPASGSPENSRLRHAQVPTDGSAPTVPDAATRTPLREADTAAGCGAADAGSHDPEHGARSRRTRPWETQRKR